MKQKTFRAAKPLRVGVIGIERSFPDPQIGEFPKLYEGIGWNTGNMMFTEAMYSLIGGAVSQIGFNFDPKMVNEKYDVVVVPAANWLNKTANWDWLTERLTELRIPVIVIGIGVQADLLDINTVEVSESAKRLVEFFKQSAPLISVRGNFTRDWLKSIGIENVVTTGCPSLYMNIFNQTVVPDNGKIVLQATRYQMSSKFLATNSINQRIFQFSGQFDLPMIYQSEPEEMELITTGKSASSLPPAEATQLARLYGYETEAELDQFLNRNGKVFYNLQEWSKFLSGHKAVIGTRLHGSIIAMNSGRPAVIVPHDSRTAEVASFAGIRALYGPTVWGCQTLEELEAFLTPDILDKYRDTRSKNQGTFVGFLKESGLTSRPENLF